MRDLSRYSIHGSIGAVVVFLIWVYISAFILLYGVEFTAAYSRMREGGPGSAGRAGAARLMMHGSAAALRHWSTAALRHCSTAALFMCLSCHRQRQHSC